MFGLQSVFRVLEYVYRPHEINIKYFHIQKFDLEWRPMCIAKLGPSKINSERLAS